MSDVIDFQKEKAKRLGAKWVTVEEDETPLMAIETWIMAMSAELAESFADDRPTDTLKGLIKAGPSRGKKRTTTVMVKEVSEVEVAKALKTLRRCRFGVGSTREAA
jgi:hypothetical protein